MIRSIPGTSFASSLSYTIVLDQSGESLNDVGFVIYVQPGLDITDAIIQDLNRGYRKNAKDPAGAAASDK